jgi:hypothetical protein
MSQKAAITVLRAREELERLWADTRHRPEFPGLEEATVRFVEAPGDHGTEIHVELADGGTSPLDLARRVRGSARLARVKDGLRRFKQQVETGEIARSEAVPEGESLPRKLKERPAQPLTSDERQKVGV